jgi:hypothetical protein
MTNYSVPCSITDATGTGGASSPSPRVSIAGFTVSGATASGYPSGISVEDGACSPGSVVLQVYIPDTIVAENPGMPCLVVIWYSKYTGSASIEGGGYYNTFNISSGAVYNSPPPCHC